MAFEALFEAAADALIVVGEDGTIVLANGRTLAMFGYERAELLGRSVESLLPSTLREAHVRHRNGFAASPQARPMGAARDLVAVRKDGSELPVDVAIGPVVLEPGGPPLYLASVRDDTERRRAREMERHLMHANRLASIGQLAAGAAHEINNPATYLVANGSVLREHVARIRSAFVEIGDANAEGRERRRREVVASLDEVEEMLTENEVGIARICAIAGNMRGFSRSAADSIEPVDLNEVVDRAVALTFNSVRHRARFVKEMGVVPRINADRGKLEQVVVNLLRNAVDAIAEGAADRHEVRVETSSRDNEVVLSVSDTGAGIPEENLERIFDPFFTTKSREVGTGLGLALSRELVRQHGGRLSVTSSAAGGTRFEIVLPHDTGLRALAPHRAGTRASTPVGRRARVLLIDDDTLVRNALRRMIEGEHDVVEMESGGAALALMRADRAFDVVLCDLVMPSPDGPAIYAELAEWAPAMLALLVFMTGGAFTPRTRAFAASVPNVFVEKPIAQRTILEVIGRKCDERSAATT